MAKQTLNNGESGLVVRNKINSMFTEIYPSAQAIDDAFLDTTRIFAIVDSAGRVVFGIGPDGVLQGKFPSVSPAELITARGLRTDLNTRLSASLGDWGYSKRYVFNEEMLRETRQRLRRRLYGETAAQLNIALIGDSFSHNVGRYGSYVAKSLIDQYGDAGYGWTGFGFGGTYTLTAAVPFLVNGSGRVTNFSDSTTAINLAYTGTWTGTYCTLGVADGSSAKSTTAGDKIVISIAASTSTINRARLHFIGATGNSATYQWGAGSIQSLDMTTAGLQIADLIGFPTDGSATTLTLTVGGTGAEFGGLDLQSAAPGVRYHKLACTGSRAQAWAILPQADFQKSIQALNVDLLIIMHGTNDQGIFRTKAQFKADVETIAQRVRQVRPTCDILLIAPPENPSTHFSQTVNDIAVSIPVTGNYALTAIEAGAGKITFTGTPGASLTVTIPATVTQAFVTGRPALASFGVARWHITNSSTQQITLAQTGATGTVIIAAGSSAIVGAGGSSMGGNILVQHGNGLPAARALMSDYAAAKAELAIDNNWTFQNLQPVFGVSPIDYAAGTERPWFSTDMIHPGSGISGGPNQGGRAMADAVLRLLTTL